MPEYDNSASFLSYGVLAANPSELTEGGGVQASMNTAGVLLAAGSSKPSPAELASLAVRVIDAIHPELSPYLRQLGEDFVWGVYAHRLLQLEAEVLAPTALTHAVVGDWSTVRICRFLGFSDAKWKSGDGYVDLANIDLGEKRVRIAEIKPDAADHRVAAQAQLDRYKGMIEGRLGRGAVTFASAKDLGLQSTPFTLGPFTYRFVSAGIIVYVIGRLDELRKLIEEVARKVARSVDDMVRFLAVLLAILAVIAASDGLLLPVLLAT